MEKNKISQNQGRKVLSEEYYNETTVKGKTTGRKYKVTTYEISSEDEFGGKNKKTVSFVKWYN